MKVFDAILTAFNLDPDIPSDIARLNILPPPNNFASMISKIEIQKVDNSPKRINFFSCCKLNPAKKRYKNTK